MSVKIYITIVFAVNRITPYNVQQEVIFLQSFSVLFCLAGTYVEGIFIYLLSSLLCRRYTNALYPL